MEEAFEKLKQQGKNDQATVISWMKEANIITDKSQELMAKQYLKMSSSGNQVDSTQLKYVIDELAKDRRMSARDLQAQLSTHSASLLASVQASLSPLAQVDEAFEKLKQQGMNDQATLISWMKEARLIADNKQEDLAKQYFKESAETEVEIGRFKAVIEKLAEEKQQSVADLHANLSAHSVGIINALKAGRDAINKAFNK